ncbi:hypothetical protein Adt_02566 [Abeliophyllum distichum]|uniref:Uncharacterized protein n=1 Tax=Abeliophyllum distichum TaxID=126358 RepID=A0ABD1VW35_9LAMI
MRNARKARRTEEGRRSSPSPDGEPEEVGNFTALAGQRNRVRISQRRNKLPTSMMEVLRAHPVIVATSAHRYWTQGWEKTVEEATIREQLQLAEMNLVRGFIRAKELFGTLESFDANEAKSKKLSEDLKAMGLEKAQLEYDKRGRDQKRAAEASQKRAEEAQKLVEDQTLTAETALATANSSLEAVVAEKEKSLAAVEQELERVRVERVDVEVKAAEAYQDTFEDTPEYQDLAQRLMTISREQLVEQIMEIHPEWDISFLHQAPTEAPASEAAPGDNRDRAEGQTTPHFVEKSPQCADP